MRTRRVDVTGYGGGRVRETTGVSLPNTKLSPWNLSHDLLYTGTATLWLNNEVSVLSWLVSSISEISEDCLFIDWDKLFEGEDKRLNDDRDGSRILFSVVNENPGLHSDVLASKILGTSGMA
jgi:hypothetical protein